MTYLELTWLLLNLGAKKLQMDFYFPGVPSGEASDFFLKAGQQKWLFLLGV